MPPASDVRRSRQDHPPPITCAGEACPRTPGFWQQQCKQLGNGSTKFTKAQVTSIAVDVQFESGQVQEQLLTPNGACPR